MPEFIPRGLTLLHSQAPLMYPRQGETGTQLVSIVVAFCYRVKRG
jgi:hypothetical protein